MSQHKPRLRLLIAGQFETMRASLAELRRLRVRALPLHAFGPVSASVLFQIAFLLSAALGIVRQSLFAAQFGTGPEASAYIAAFRLPETMLNLIGGGALSSALVAVLLRTRAEDGRDAEHRLIDLTLSTVGVVTLVLALPAALLAEPFVRYVLAPGFDAPTSALTVWLARWMLLQPLLLLPTTVATAVIASRNQFFLSALALAVHNVVLILGILAVRVVPGLGITGPLIGMLLDAVMQVALLAPGLWANGFRVRFAWDLANRRLRQVFRLFIPSGLSAIVNYSGTIIDTAAASFAREAGALPSLNNALLLIGLPTRLLGQAVASAVYPRIAAHAARNEWHAAQRMLRNALLTACGLSLPAAASLVVLGRWIVTLLFERGAFGAAASDLTYAALVGYTLGLPFYIATELCSRALAALYDTRTPLLTNILQVICRVLIILALLGPFGAVAIPLAFALSSLVESLVLGLVVTLRLRQHLQDGQNNKQSAQK